MHILHIFQQEKCFGNVFLVSFIFFCESHLHYLCPEKEQDLW